MALLQVDPAGLEALAVRCHCLAGELGAGSAAPQMSLPSGQATAAAVHSVHANMTTAAAAMTARLASTSMKLTTAASAFAEQETTSAGKLASLAPSAV